METWKLPSPITLLYTSPGISHLRKTHILWRCIYFPINFWIYSIPQIHLKYASDRLLWVHKKQNLPGVGGGYTIIHSVASLSRSHLPLEGEAYSIDLYLIFSYQFWICNFQTNSSKVCIRSLSLSPQNAKYSLSGREIPPPTPTPARSLRSLTSHLPLEEDAYSMNVYLTN